MLLGYRDLRHIRYYEGDSLVGHLLEFKRLPNVATISRALSETDEQSVIGSPTTTKHPGFGIFCITSFETYNTGL